MTNKFLQFGSDDAPIVVLCDPPSKAAVQSNIPLSFEALELFAEVANEVGIEKKDVVFINVCPYLTEEQYATKSRQNKALAEHRESFLQTFAKFKPKAILALGGLALTQLSGKAVKITKCRGQITQYDASGDVPVIATNAPGYVVRSPQHLPAFKADVRMLKHLQLKDYSMDACKIDEPKYSWCTDLSEWLGENKPKIISFDTETTGLSFVKPEVFPLTVQLCRKTGEAIMIPVQEWFVPQLERNHDLVISQLKELLEDPTVLKVAHNIKFDHHMVEKLGITTQGWKYDTAVMAFAVNENMTSRSLAECTRVYVPEMAGYSDVFDATVDKSRMDEVDLDELLTYGCGDADATLRLCKVLQAELVKDAKQMKLINTVQMPGLRAFAESLETNGVPVDVDALNEFAVFLQEEEQRLYEILIKQVPVAVRKKHLGQKKELSFGRAAFLIDILFSPLGFNLKPVVFTDTTKKLPPDQRVPSISAKTHLPYFADNVFVQDLIEYKKITKMRSTYVGVPESENGPATGFYKHIYNNQIRPTYRLDGTVTGRTSSQDPNGQNLPKRGQLAKVYRKVFCAPVGYTFIQADYSQAELRVAACMAAERRMIQAYQNGEDLHLLTASALMGLTMQEFLALPEEVQDEMRFRAKAANFGLLYGMQAKAYQSYAYLNYGAKLTLDEATRDRDLFFALYGDLTAWHEATIQFAHLHGYVRSLHGAKRTLPDLTSSDNAMRSMAERQALNSPVQRFASDLGVIALTRINRDLKNANGLIPLKACMFIHDALVFLVKDEYLDQGMAAIKFYMESNPLQEMFGINLQVPMVADIEFGKNLSALQKAKTVKAVAPHWYTSL